MIRKLSPLRKAVRISLWALLYVASSNSIADVSHHKIVDTTLTLDIHFHFERSKSVVYNNNWPVEKKASELTGIALNNVTQSPNLGSIEAFNLLLANGNLPDIVGGRLLREKFNTYGPEGLFLPLNALIQEHAPNIKAFFDENPKILKAISAADGKLYHIPYIPDGKFGKAYFIRTDWLETLGLDRPDTVAELYNVLTAFKNDDPNQNGLADEVPLFFRHNSDVARLVTLWDGRSSGSDKSHDFYIEQGEVKHGYVLENYRIGIKNLAKWYREGLIDADVFIANRNARAELLQANRGGMTFDWFASTAGYNTKLESKIPGFVFKPIIPPLSSGGKRLAEHRRTAVKPDGWAITHVNQAIIPTIKYFDFWFSETGKRLANFGVEGEHYTLIDGRPVFTDAILHGELPVNTILSSIGAQIPRGFPQDYEYEKQWTNKIALEGIAMYEKGDFLVDPFYDVVLSEAEKDVVDFYWDDILAFMVERQQDWMLGTRDIDNDWNKYLRQVDKMGFKKVMQVMQAAYDRQYGSTQKAELMD